MNEPDELLLRKALTGAVAELAEQRRLTVVDLAAEGLVVWDLHRDPAGTPQGRARPTVTWDELYAGPVPPEQALVRAVNADPSAGLVLACTFSAGTRSADALERLRRAHPDTAAFTCDVRLGDLLREVIAHDPLTHWYDLVGLRNTEHGRLELFCHQLFPIGAQRGDTAHVSVRCEASDEHGTVFAVVSSQEERRYRRVSVQSAKLPPGRYDLTAELRRPGLVRFHGLPVVPVRERRDWSELIAAVPPRLAPSASTHLICLVETGGPADRVAERLSRTAQVITNAVDDLHDRLRVSLVSYGAHSFDRRVPESPVEVLLHGGTADRALAEVDRLDGLGAADTGYPHAAQLECALAEAVHLLDAPASGDRTVLLTIGDRPAHPPRVHRSEILPCPRRCDWRTALHRLESHPGMAFGAICDRPPDRAGEIWELLGGGAPASLDAVDVRRLGEDLGLAPTTAQRVPFPLIPS